MTLERAFQFWNVISNEHGISPTGHFTGSSHLQWERLSVYYREGFNETHYARAICADTDPASVEKLKYSPMSNIFSPDNVVQGNEGTGNNFAKGFYTEGAELMDPLLETIRREAENCDNIQGFKIIHSLGGGTGSGAGAQLINSLCEEYPENLIMTFSTIPSPKVSESVVEPYNTILALPHIISNTQLSFFMDNDTIYDICVRNLKLKGASMMDLNHIIAHTMSGVTTGFRFPGQLNTSLRKLYVNMVPMPNLHSFVPGFAPLTSSERIPYVKLSPAELVQQIFSSKNLLADVDLRKGKILTVSAIFRGLLSPKEIDTLMINVRNRNLSYFVDWIPNNIKTAICDIPPRGLKMSATFIGNTTGIAQLFEKSSKSFRGMFNRKAFLHWYTGEGMEEQEFLDADMALRDLMEEYKNGDKEAIEEEETKKRRSSSVVEDFKKCAHCSG